MEGGNALQWHTAFQAALQIELLEEREYLQFEKEYNLTQKPLQIDTLIIKLDSGRSVKKKLGRIFRQYNIVEYKNPGDYLSINDYYKVSAYACLYQSDTERVGEILPEENLWLSRLRQDLTIGDIDPLARAYKGKEKNPMYSAVMDFIVRANRKQYESLH